MKVYHLKRRQIIPISINEAWDFFSLPGNLVQITPATMDFRITYQTGDVRSIFPGKIICYLVKILPGYSTRWVSEITHVQKPKYFVDEQRSGPYSIWHHEHHFREVPEGVEVTDEVTYAIPFGVLGRLANHLFVKRQLDSIFDYRFEALEKMFSSRMVINKSA